MDFETLAAGKNLDIVYIFVVYGFELPVIHFRISFIWMNGYMIKLT